MDFIKGNVSIEENIWYCIPSAYIYRILMVSFTLLFLFLIKRKHVENGAFGPNCSRNLGSSGQCCHSFRLSALGLKGPCHTSETYSMTPCKGSVVKLTWWPWDHCHELSTLKEKSHCENKFYLGETKQFFFYSVTHATCCAEGRMWVQAVAWRSGQAPSTAMCGPCFSGIPELSGSLCWMGPGEGYLYRWERLQ